MGICTCPPQEVDGATALGEVADAPGDCHLRNYNGVILAWFGAPRKGEARDSGVFVASGGWLRNTFRAMPAHLRPPERRMAHPLGVLAVAVAVSLVVIAAFSSRPSDEGTTNRLIQPVTETSETVLGEVIERATVPEAPAADAQGFTTTTSGSSGSSGSGGGGGGGTGTTVGNPSPNSPSPTLGPPVSITAPPTTRPSTTTSSTTTTTEATTTTESTTTTAAP